MGYGFAQGMGDFLGDFNDESNKIRTANDKKAADDAQIEQRALEHLANADDPQIRAAAVTAMLTPKKAAGGSALGKWFGTQRDHPVFSQVHSLVNGGHQPFMGVEERANAATAGTVSGRIAGANTGYRDITGEDLPNEALARGAQGALGAPPNRRQMPQWGTITLQDGTTVAGSFDPETQEFADSDGQYISGAKAFTRGNTGPRAGANPNPGATWITQPVPGQPGQFQKVHVDAQGKPIGAPVPASGPNTPPMPVFQTPGGFTAVDNRGTDPHTVPVRGGEGVTTPSSPGINFDSLRKIAEDVERRANASVAHFGGLPPDEQELGGAREREAKAAGFNSWKDLQDQIAAGQRAIGGAVQGQGVNAPPSGVDDAGGAPPAAPRGAGAPPTAPQARPGSTKPAETPMRGASPTPPKKGAKAAVPGKLDINAILAELDKLNKNF